MGEAQGQAGTAGPVGALGAQMLDAQDFCLECFGGMFIFAAVKQVP